MRKTSSSRSKTVIIVIVIAVVASAVGIAAYSYSKSSSASSSSSSSSSSSPSTALSLSSNAIGIATNGVGAQQRQLPASQSTSKAADFNLKALDGKQVSLESFKGKPVVLWFMATWCSSCVGQADAIKKITSEYGSKINVLVIDLWAAQNIGGQNAQGFNAETESDLQSFIAKYGSPEWSGALDTDRVSIKYGVTQVDSTVVVDGNGNIVMMHLGPSGYQPIKDALAKTIV